MNEKMKKALITLQRKIDKLENNNFLIKNYIGPEESCQYKNLKEWILSLK